MEPFNQVELQLAARNHGMPLEALRYTLTPAGLHYLLIHFDIPAVDPATFELMLGPQEGAPAGCKGRRPKRPPRRSCRWGPSGDQGLLVGGCQVDSCSFA